MKEQLREALKLLYVSLFKNVAEFDFEKAVFCMQWGKDFPTESNKGILFVGRAVNGWDKADNADEVFDEGSGIFAAENQMRWVEEDGELSESAFWRVVKGVASHFYPEKWWAHVAWSNVCKVAPYSGGNPSDSLYYAQLEDCCKILQEEIRILSPKVVVFLTGDNWGNDFLSYLNSKEMPQIIKTETWESNNGKEYNCKVCKIGEVTCLASVHPMRKAESPHAECLIKLISEYLD